MLEMFAGGDPLSKRPTGALAAVLLGLDARRMDTPLARAF